MMGILKYIGAAYIVWLAIHILMSKPTEEVIDKKGDFWKTTSKTVCNTFPCNECCHGCGFNMECFSHSVVRKYVTQFLSESFCAYYV